MTNPMRYPLAAALIGLGLAGAAGAHTPLCSCYDNGDGTVLCEGGFSDGASASGVRMIVRDGAGNVVIEGTIDGNGEYSFDKPDGVFSVNFEGGEGHSIVIPSDEIC